MDWDDARFFLAVVRTGSLAAASRLLQCSHSTVRRRVAMLEESVGVRLFVATSEGLVMTDAALQAVPKAEALEDAALAFERQVSGKSQQFSGRIVITTIDVLAESIAGTIATFKAQHPQVELNLVSDNRYLDLSRRGADVAIRVGQSPDTSLFGRRVGEFRFAPFAAQSLIDRHGRNPEDLPWILWDERARATLTERWYRSVAPGREPIVRTTSAGTILALAAAGVGAAIAPTFLGRRMGLVQLDDEVESLSTDIWCLTHYDLRQSARIRAFMQCVAETADFRLDGGRA